MKMISPRPFFSCAAIAGVACAFALISASWALAQSSHPTVDVDIAKFTFGPKDITVAPGTRIRWTNHDEAPHTVAANDKTFASKGLDTDDAFEHEFATEGDFAYICTVHPFMTGVVHVKKQ